MLGSTIFALTRFSGKGNAQAPLLLVAHSVVFVEGLLDGRVHEDVALVLVSLLEVVGLHDLAKLVEFESRFLPNHFSFALLLQHCAPVVEPGGGVCRVDLVENPPIRIAVCGRIERVHILLYIFLDIFFELKFYLTFIINLKESLLLKYLK